MAHVKFYRMCQARLYVRFQWQKQKTAIFACEPFLEFICVKSVVSAGFWMKIVWCSLLKQRRNYDDKVQRMFWKILAAKILELYTAVMALMRGNKIRESYVACV